MNKEDLWKLIKNRGKTVSTLIPYCVISDG